MITRRTFQTGLLGVVAGHAAYGAEALSAHGSWSGVLDAGAQRLRLKLEIDADGSARISSLDQGSQPTPGRSTLQAADRIEIEFPSIRTVYVGTTSERTVTHDAPTRSVRVRTTIPWHSDQPGECT